MKKIKMQSLLYLYIIICPILDCSSYIFRNTLNTSISISTILRPIIIIIASIYIFITDKKRRKIFIVAGITYGLYALTHLYIFTTIKNNSSYSGVTHELQYLVNYTFMVLNLYIYLYFFGKNKNVTKFYQIVLISTAIYVVSLYVSMLTGTISSTYMSEGMGAKGWFESGNSLSAILILAMFLLFNIFEKDDINIKTKIFAGIVILGVGIYSILFIGTRVGLYGFILVVGIFGIARLVYNLIHKKNVKLSLFILAIGFITIILIIVLFGSTTIERRKKVEEMANDVIDTETNDKVHITGDMYEIKKKIENGTLEDGYMSEAQKQAVLSMNEIATKYDLSVEQMRVLQLIYHVELAKNQSNILYALFGNGYVSQYREMVFEMELLAIPINFGFYGFILYILPFMLIYGYSFCIIIKNIKKVDVECIMLTAGGGFAFVLSLLSGYIFFNASTTMIIITINLLLLNKAKEMRKV